MKRIDSKDSREVNNLLHTLRGEQFRHQQNVKRLRTHMTTPRSHSTPTLPIRFTALEYDTSISTDAPSPSITHISYAGPAPPKSWSSSVQRNDHDTKAWHTRALGLVASHLGNFTETLRVPSLALLCLKIILSNCTSKAGFEDDVVPYIPYHLRRDVIRYCAIHSPLPNWKLHALLSPQGNADGEMLIMGPATLPEDHFIRRINATEEFDSSAQPPTALTQIRDWEADENPEYPLHTLILVSTHLSTSNLFAFPPTITLLALIDLPISIPIHRLPKLCPMLVLLDLSFNSWLEDPATEGVKYLEKTPWGRWKSLETVGLRGCHVSDALLQEINAGRWDDVEVVTN